LSVGFSTIPTGHLSELGKGKPPQPRNYDITGLIGPSKFIIRSKKIRPENVILKRETSRFRIEEHLLIPHRCPFAGLAHVRKIGAIVGP